MPVAHDKAPFPWAGGKSKAAPAVWAALGDVAHYCEAFFGSGAVLLNRPHPCNRPYFSESVNDADAMLTNAWRAIQWRPEETAAHASWPVSELDKQARQAALLRWRDERVVDLLAGSPEWCDPKMAGWWLYGVCCQIGCFTGDGPWVADPVSGRLIKQGRPGVKRNRPHLTTNGRGVNHAGTREPGVSRDLPHLGDNGRGVNHAGTREPGVSRDLPHLGNDGQGVNHAGTREPGVLSDLADNEFHPWTMPELVRWFQWLSARLRHVRILCGDWSRLCTGGAMFTLPVRQNKGVCGVFLDPPYANGERARGLYAHDDGSVTEAVRDWCIRWGPDKRLRIVLAGYDTEHAVLTSHGWREVEWFAEGWLQGGMGQQGPNGHQQDRERLWCSPHCLRPEEAPPGPAQRGLFDSLEGDTDDGETIEEGSGPVVQ